MPTSVLCANLCQCACLPWSFGTAVQALAQLAELQSAAESDRENAAAALSQVQAELAKACAAADLLRRQASELQQQYATCVLVVVLRATVPSIHLKHVFDYGQ